MAIWHRILHWYYRLQIDRKTKKIQEFNEWLEKKGGNKMKPIPNKGEYYHFWDDGKLGLGRHYICRCERIIPFREFAEIKLMRFDYGKKGLVEDTLLNLWKDSVGKVDWIFARQTDCAVVCSCPKYDRDELYFFRTKSGGWFSADRTSSWQSGDLDVDGEIYRSVIADCINKEVREAHEEITY